MAVFPVREIPEELAEITVQEDGKDVFRGIVDEQTVKLSPFGLQLELTCRSLAALLLDCEAMPEALQLLTADDLEEKYLTPLGLRYGESDRTARARGITLTKGDSCWEAVAMFWEKTFGGTPCVRPDGSIGRPEKKVYSIPASQVITLRHNVQPCRRIGDVVVQSSGGEYDTVFRAENGSTNRRYLESPVTTHPRRLQEQRQQESASITVVCPGELWLGRGDLVSVMAPPVGWFESCSVLGVQIMVGDEGTMTELTAAISPPEGGEQE